MPRKTDKRVAGKADFFGLNGLPFEDIHVPEFGEEMVARVKALDALRGYIVASAVYDKGTEYTRAAYVAGCVVDENDQPVFSLEDIDRLMKMDWNLIRRLSDAAFRVNGIRTGDREETEQNFERPQG